VILGIAEERHAHIPGILIINGNSFDFCHAKRILWRLNHCSAVLATYGLPNDTQRCVIVYSFLLGRLIWHLYLYDGCLINTYTIEAKLMTLQSLVDNICILLYAEIAKVVHHTHISVARRRSRRMSEEQPLKPMPQPCWSVVIKPEAQLLSLPTPVGLKRRTLHTC
jgi:hypothetical protein